MFFNMDRDPYRRVYGTVDILQIFCKPEAHLKRTVNRKRPKVRYEILSIKVLNCCFSIMCQAFVVYVSFKNKRCPHRGAAKKTEMFFNMDRDPYRRVYGTVDILQIFCKPEAHLKRTVNRKRPKVRYEILSIKVLNCCFSIMCQAFVVYVSF